MKIVKDVFGDLNLSSLSDRLVGIMELRFNEGAELVSSQIISDSNAFYAVLLWRYK